MNNNLLMSFIIPVYNEELNIAHVLANLHQVLAQYPQWTWQIIVIEDGSTDNTRAVILEEAKKYPRIEVILHNINQGYTGSLKDGIRKAQGKHLMYIGADEEFDSSEIPSFVTPLLNNEADIILGVRWQRNAYQLFRFFLSIIYIFLLNYMFKLRVNDYNWSQAWPKSFFSTFEFSSNSLFVLPEIIIRAYDAKYRVIEVPSNHRGRQAGKSSLNMRIMGHSLVESFKFFFYRKSTKYASQTARGAKDAMHLSAEPTQTS